MNDENIRKALAQLTSENEEVARAALDHLYIHSKPILLHYLRRRFTPQNPADCEEVIQDAFIKVWRARANFMGLGIPAWYKYIRVVAVRCYLDWIEQRNRHIPPLPPIDSPGPDVWGIYDDTCNGETARKILHAADSLWLGIPAELSPAQRTRQVLAAKWFYLEGASCQEVIDLLGPPLPGEAALTRRMLDTWLSHEGILRAMAYEELHYDNDRLVWRLLGQTGPVRQGRLDALCRDMSQGVVPHDVAVILWHYRYGLSADDIAARITPAIKEAQVQEMLDSLRDHLPFKSQMQHLLECLEPKMGAQARSLVCEAGLWQRLAFQYNYADELGQKDVMQRLQPCAQVAEYYLTPAMLNVWLSGRRLSSRLARYYAAQRRAQSDE